MEKNLKTIVEELIQPNQVVLIGETTDKETNLNVIVGLTASSDARTERHTRLLALAFNGVLATAGDAEKLLALADLGYKVTVQQAALEAAQKEN